MKGSVIMIKDVQGVETRQSAQIRDSATERGSLKISVRIKMRHDEGTASKAFNGDVMGQRWGSGR